MWKWLKRQRSENQLLWSAVVVTVAGIVTLIPLYVIALYNYPTSDDFAYADSIYQNIKNGATWLTILKGAWAEGLVYYHGWQGRYFDDMVSTFGIGVAVPQLYFIGSFVVLSLFMVSTIVFFRLVLHKIAGWDARLVWIMSLYLIIMQVMYVPYATEAFYWYVGATGYTGTYALMLFLFTALISFYRVRGIRKKIGIGILAVILTLFVGGSNYATGLLTLELLVLCVFLVYFHKHRGLFSICILLEYLACFALNACSRGNLNRMKNVEGMSSLQSILASLQRGAIFCKEWFHIPILIMLILLTLLSLRSIVAMKYQFALPGLVTLISFGLFCSILTPPFFASATWGPGRLINILYYAYDILLLVNLLYWMGWILHHVASIASLVQRSNLENRFGLFLTVVAFFALVICLKFYGLQSTNTTSAALSLIKGEAAQYKEENEARWNIYEDESITNAEVADFSVKPYVLYHDDITTDATDWRNTTTANFFGKESVKIKE